MTVVDASVTFIKISADQTVAIVAYTAFTFVFSKYTQTNFKNVNTTSHKIRRVALRKFNINAPKLTQLAKEV